MSRPLSVAVLSLVLFGCPESGIDGVCVGEGAPGVEASNREDGSPTLTDGAEVGVFPPPQGGVFTELDVLLFGVDEPEVLNLRVDVTARADGAMLAAQLYRGDALPLACQEDASLGIQNLPVGFVESTVLVDLEGVEATIDMELTTVDEGTANAAYDVVLRVSAF